MSGWNGNGQLGVGHFTNINVPIPVSGLQQRIVKVACGWNHTMVLTSMFYFVCIFCIFCIHACIANVMHLLFLDLGELYTWGSNSFGQLGLPHVQRQTNTPDRLSQEV